MPISPEEHNEKRRVTKQKQRANARAAAAYKRRKSEDNQAHDGVVEALFSQKTISNFNNNFFVQKSNSVSERTLKKLISSNEISVEVVPEETVFYPRELLVTFDGFKPVDGKELPLSISKIRVRLGKELFVTFRYRFNKTTKEYFMNVGYEFAVPEYV